MVYLRTFCTSVHFCCAPKSVLTIRFINLKRRRKKRKRKRRKKEGRRQTVKHEATGKFSQRNSNLFLRI
jgi:hypothetical protein